MKAQKEPQLSSNPSKGRTQPPAVRARAIDLYQRGHATPEIAKAIGVNVSTVRRWCRTVGASHGSALSYAAPAASPAEILNPAVVAPRAANLLDKLETDLSPTQRLMNANDIMGAIEDAMNRPGDTADRYQAIMVALGLNVLKQSAAMPPPVKTIRDLATLNEIIRTNLGLNAKGGGSSLAINLNVLTKQSGNSSVAVEAEILDEQ